VRKLAIPPNYNDPIVLTRQGESKRLVGVYLGKRFDMPSPFALIMLIVLAGLFFAFVVLGETELWYLGVVSLAALFCLFLLIPVSRRGNLKGNA